MTLKLTDRDIAFIELCRRIGHSGDTILVTIKDGQPHIVTNIIQRIDLSKEDAGRITEGLVIDLSGLLYGDITPPPRKST